MTEDRDLLYAIFTQHLGFTSPREVLGLGAEWVARRGQGVTFRQVLREHGLLAEDQARLVDALVLEAMSHSGDDAKQALDALPRKLRHSLSGLSHTLRTDPGETSLSDGGLEARQVSFTDSLESEQHLSSEEPGRYSFDTGPRGRTEELGRGGVGRVVVAEDHFLGRQVAMKEILRDFTGNMATNTIQSSVMEARFLREARLTGQLEHPAVVPVYELGRRTDGTLYYVMKRVRGRTLGDALAEAGSLEGRLACVADVLTVCRAIASAHHQGIIHRDLKPQNIMLGAFGATFVMDWGLARVLGRSDVPLRTVEAAPDLTTGHKLGAMGTPSYMSPEQAMGELDRVDERSDVWGLGAILFELLCGRPPYQGVSPWDVVAQVRSEPVPNVLDLEPAAPPELAAICQKALQRNPERRYASAKVMADDLSAWLEDEPVPAYRYSVREVARRVARRHKVAAAVAAAVVVGLVAALSLTALKVREERNEARDFARFALDEVAGKLEDTPGSADLFGQLLNSSLAVYQQSVDVDSGPRDEVLRLVKAVHRLGYLSWAQGRYGDAQKAFTEARAMEQKLALRFPEDSEVLAALLRTGAGLASVATDQVKIEEGLRQFRDLLPLARRAVAVAPLSGEVQQAAAEVHSGLGMSLNNANRFSEALPEVDEAVAIRERWLTLHPNDTEVMRYLAFDLSTRGLVLSSLDRLTEARASIERAHAAAQELFAQLQSVSARAMRAAVAHDLGRLELQARNQEACARWERAVVEDYQAVLAVDARNVTATWLSTEALLMLGDGKAALERARPLAALPDYEGLLALAAFAAGEDAEAARFSATDGKSFRTEGLYVRAVLAELRGDHVAAAEALTAMDTPEGDVYLLAPWAVSLRVAGRAGPRAGTVQRWGEALLSRPLTIPELRATLRALAAETRAAAGGPQ